MSGENTIAALARGGLKGLALGAFAIAEVAFAQADGTDQQVSGLEAEVEMSATEAGALQLAAKLGQAGDLTGAASVLERYLIIDREAVAARAEYAILLCRLDDVDAGRFEQGKLASIPAGQDVMNRVGAACGDASVARFGTGNGSVRP